MNDVPAWIKHARDQWTNRGQVRPPFAARIETGQESVWDYPRPPMIQADSREVVVKTNDVIIAKTDRALRVLETASPPTFYLPPDDVRTEFLHASGGGSICEWKGQARYWSVVPPNATPLVDAAWSYDQPFAGFEVIAGWFSFYPARLECFVEGVRVVPQPGNLYGGWITPEVIGPFKGEPGTAGW